MHERTERAIARLLFVFCCAVPTFFTFAVVFVTWTPWYHNRQLATLEANMSRETGLVVTIKDFDRPSPYKWSLHGIRICEPETELEVANVRLVELMREDGRVRVVLHQPELQSTQLQNVWQMVHDRFLCRPELTNFPLKLAANDLTIRSNTGSMTLTNLLMLLTPRPNSVEASLRFLPAGRNRLPVNVAVTRDRSTDVPKTQWTLETGPTPLPCSALAGYLPRLKRLGPEAEFCGTLHWETQRDGGWSVDLSGSRFTAIDLGGVFDGLPHSIRGKADLVLDRCHIVPLQKVDLAGTVRSSGGWVRTSLLRAMKSDLGFAVDDQAIANPDGEVFYELLALHFDMKDWDLKLSGDCVNQEFYEWAQPGMALYGSRNRKLAMSTGESIPSTRLAYAIAPQHSEMVPISRQTSGLLSLFVPPSQPIPSYDGRLPSSRNVRAAHWSGGPPIQQR